MNVTESNELVVNNMALLASRVKNFNVKDSNEREEIKSIGSLALVKASRTWDPSKSKFSTYATICIDNAIKTFFSSKKKKFMFNLNDCFDMIETEDDLSILNDYEDLSEFVLKCKSLGQTSKEIAQKYNLKVSTVDNLYQKAKANYAAKNINGE